MNKGTRLVAVWPAVLLGGTGCLVGEPPPFELSPDVCSNLAGPINPDSEPFYNAYGTPGPHPLGTVTTYAWQGQNGTYPNGDEDFSGYGPPLPATVECSSDKAAQSHLAVTDGCLNAIHDGTQGTVGQIMGGVRDDAFRVVALGYSSSEPGLDVKWTDTGTSYRFFYRKQTGNYNLPGFKAFLRYRTEDDLYVASWRMDGVVQVQRKLCGKYTPLEIVENYPIPTPDTWHQVEFTAVGSQLDFYVDGNHVIDVSDSTFSWGTAGVRIDSMNGGLIDEWKVFEPGDATDPLGGSGSGGSGSGSG